MKRLLAATVSAALVGLFLPSGVAMAATSTVNIPLQTVPAAPPATIVGTLTTHTSLTSATIHLDRTVAGGMNSLPSTATITIEVDLSFDGGATWTEWSSDTTPGGFVPDDHGNPETSQDIFFSFNPPIPRKTEGRLVIIPSQAVAIQGSVSLND